MEQSQIHNLISEVTGAQDPATVQDYEQYMRDEVFHSTLGWIDEFMLRMAAARAHEVLDGRRVTSFYCVEFKGHGKPFEGNQGTRYLLTSGIFGQPTEGRIALFPDAKNAIEEGCKAPNRRDSSVVSAVDRNPEPISLH
ncbi:hypothetical protein [Nitrogeniibacter aestuarii]|uniref:hypothetical protein n=1 Tax=Nitrogeniibacter aestuarii TaxID=2815343 RepID=UPI001E31118B|nr:hypothetical protein [Nitrogeniibacter aestuarii]